MTQAPYLKPDKYFSVDDQNIKIVSTAPTCQNPFLRKPNGAERLMKINNFYLDASKCKP